jgi:hypothetical protein
MALPRPDSKDFWLLTLPKSHPLSLSLSLSLSRDHATRGTKAWSQCVRTCAWRGSAPWCGARAMGRGHAGFDGLRKRTLQLPARIPLRLLCSAHVALMSARSWPSSEWARRHCPCLTQPAPEHTHGARVNGVDFASAFRIQRLGTVRLGLPMESFKETYRRAIEDDRSLPHSSPRSQGSAVRWHSCSEPH